MSSFLNRADALAEYLTALPALAGIDVIVDRQKDVLSEIAKRLAVVNGRGAAVVIMFHGGKNLNPKANTLEMDNRYSVSLWGRPVLRSSEDAPLDDLTETVARAIHHWSPTASPNTHRRRLEVLAIELVPDKALLIYEIVVRMNVLIPTQSNP